MSTDHITASAVLKEGITLQLGKYRVVRFLSSGGFGNTYEVENTAFGERMAMKEFFMRGVNERNEDSVSISVSNAENRNQFEAQKEKLKKEARRLRKLANENIIRVHDLFEENGTVYYVMDYIDGESLSTRIKRTGKPLTENEVLGILPQVLNALETVHAQDIWHLDIKPANVMIDKDGKCKLIDFGASKQLQSSDGVSIATSTALCYTPGYAPLEQIEQDFSKFGPWTDFYSLGATLYYLLTAKQPPSTSEIAEGNAFEFPSDISATLPDLIRWLMQPARRKRPQSVKEIREFLSEKEKDAAKEETAASAIQEDDDATILIAPPSKEPQTTSHQDTPVNDPSAVKIIPTGNDKKTYFIQSFLAIFIITVFVFVFFGLSHCNTKGINGIAGDSDTVWTDTCAYDTIMVDSFAEDSVAVDYPSEESGAVSFPFESKIGQCSYRGSVDENGLPHGEGIAFFSDGREYRGGFSHGNLDGDAIYVLANGDTFEGTFKNNAYAQGRYTIKADGSYFEGTYKNGQPNQGTWYDKDGNLIE